jgi:hypothetical protein
LCVAGRFSDFSSDILVFSVLLGRERRKKDKCYGERRILEGKHLSEREREWTSLAKGLWQGGGGGGGGVGALTSKSGIIRISSSSLSK